MKTWIAKIRITDEGFQNYEKTVTEFLTQNQIQNQLLCADLGTAGLEIDSVVSLEEEVEHPKEK